MMQGSLSSRLRLLRVQRGLTLQEASDVLGIDRHTLSSIERGTQTPHAPTLKKIAEGYGVPLENLLDLEEEEKQAAVLATPGKVEAPLETQESPDQRSLSYVNAWATFVDELSGDIEEWKYEETGGALDPADLPEDEFLPFIKAAMPFVKTYQRVYQVVYADEVGLLPLLQEEVRLRGRMDKEVERFERAFKRLSRAMQGVLTERVAQRVNQLAQAEEAKVTENVVSLFGEVSGEARSVA
jgi:transcriptional regulator with XRE-family HTH domain